MSATVQTALAMMQSDILNDAVERAAQMVLGVVGVADKGGKPITSHKDADAHRSPQAWG